MSQKSLNMSSTGLKNIVLNHFTEEDDFSLIFGRQEIKMNRIFAEFISPVVSHLHQTDPTVDCFDFSDSFPKKSSDSTIISKDILSSDIIFLIQKVSSGFSIEIDDTQAFKLRILSVILGNEELFSKINEIFPLNFSKENLNTYLEYIQYCHTLSQYSPDFDFSELINYISENFYSIEEDKFLNLPRTIQYSIISNSHLQIQSEDSLLDIIIQIINEDDRTSSEKVRKDDEMIDDILFLEQVEFASLTEEKLIEFLSTFDFNCMTNSLWRKFYECFFIHFNSKSERIRKRHSEEKVIEYIENITSRFNGILNYLNEKFGGNSNEKKVCKFSSSSILKNYLPRNVCNYSNDYSGFSTISTIDSADAWLKIDFLCRKIHPTHYSIRTWPVQKGESHLKNWAIEGSNTDRENDWVVLDARNNQICLNGNLAENTFKIQNIHDDNAFYRYIRIRQTGLNCKHTNQLIIGSLEFFGKIL